MSRKPRIDIRTQRVYDAPEVGDGTRILVDRVWPRGMSRERLNADLWLKEVAPSTELRKWFAHDPAKWTGFQTRYRKELEDRPEPVTLLLMAALEGPLTLLYSAKDTEQNQAVALRAYLQELASG